MIDIFEYLNEIEKVGKTSCPYKTAEEFTQPENVFEVMKYLALSVYKTTNEKLLASNATQKEKTNSLFGIDLIKMAAIHIKFVGVKIMKKRSETQYSCENFMKHRQNLGVLLALHFV